MLRGTWSLVHAVACAKHDCLFVDHCDCGPKLHPTQRDDDALTCACGKPFAEIATLPASAEALLGTRWLIYRLHWWSVQDIIEVTKWRMLPEPFQSMPVATSCRSSR